MTRPSRYPVASFGPELMAALIKGAEQEVVIPVPDARTLMFLQNRIHMLRGAMGRERHPNYALVQRARTSRMWDEPDNKKVKKPTKDAKNFRLIIRPNDHQFAKMIEAAGVNVDTAVMRDVLEDVVSDTPADPTTTPSTEPTPSTSGEDPYGQYK